MSELQNAGMRRKTMKLTDEHGCQPIWHNEQWMIFDDVIQQIKPHAQASAYWMPKSQITADSNQTFNHIAAKTWVDINELGKCFDKLSELGWIPENWIDLEKETPQ